MRDTSAVFFVWWSSFASFNLGDVSVQALQEADPKMGLAVQEICWGGSGGPMMDKGKEAGIGRKSLRTAMLT